jgi:hypothetical protein
MRTRTGRSRTFVVALLLTLGVIASAVPVAADTHPGPWPKHNSLAVKAGR